MSWFSWLFKKEPKKSEPPAPKSDFQVINRTTSTETVTDASAGVKPSPEPATSSNLWNTWYGKFNHARECERRIHQAQTGQHGKLKGGLSWRT